MENGIYTVPLRTPRQKWFYKVECNMKTDSSCRNGLHIPLLFIMLLLQERNFSHTHTQKHPSTYLQFKFSKTV